MASPNPERTFGQAKNFRCRPILTVRRAVGDWPQFAFAVVPGVGHESPLSRQRRAIAPIGLTLIGVRIVDLARRLNCTLGCAGMPSDDNCRRQDHEPRRGDGAWGAYRCATNGGGGGYGPGHTGNDGTAHTSQLFASESFSPRDPAPAAPPLPAQYAIRRDKSDESAISPRRSTPPANPAPR